jgi:hypothetical protein
MLHLVAEHFCSKTKHTQLYSPASLRLLPLLGPPRVFGEARQLLRRRHRGANQLAQLRRVSHHAGAVHV